MPSFGTKSLSKLKTCHPDLIAICIETVKIFDISVLEGARSDEQQHKYFLDGKSKLDGITRKSKHQVTPDKPLSMAVDIAPYPVKFDSQTKIIARFYMMAGVMFAIAEYLYEHGEIEHKLRWGGDWNGNHDFEDQSFDDLPHFELIKV